MDEAQSELLKIERKLADASIAAKRPNGLRWRTHERVQKLVEERDELRTKLDSFSFDSGDGVSGGD